MDCSVVVRFALRPDARAFEAYFRDRVQKIRTESWYGEHVRFLLYRPVGGGKEFVWVTRFPEEELNSVNRANWPFVVLAMLDVLRDLKQRFAADLSIVASSVLTAEELMDRWNDRRGKFGKLSLVDKPVL